MTFTASAQLTVTAPQLVGLELSPATASLVIGQSQQFQATALYDDGTRQNVTTSSQWSSSAQNVLAVSDAAAGADRAQAAAARRRRASRWRWRPAR